MKIRMKKNAKTDENLLYKINRIEANNVIVNVKLHVLVHK